MKRRKSSDGLSLYNVYIPGANALGDDDGHEPWLDARKDEFEWSFWERYTRFLSLEGTMPPASLTRLDTITEDILGRLEVPDRPGPWDRRGLVAGQVQSGKTANYIGLIAKAIDAGYKLIVVLAGVHNSLRSQTQARIDEGILGFDTRNQLRFDQQGNARIGVGTIGGRFLPVNSFTSSKQGGDFSLSVARNIGVAVGGNDPIVLVVKKNGSILKNLHKWATALRQEVDPTTGKPIVRGVPVLVIDDESDNASVDTNGPKRGQDPEDVDPTKINGLIRTFLNTFEQTAYVAYTATPYANIFIPSDADHPDAGKDLFPSSFIVNLPASSSYIGPARVFGLEANDAAGIEAIDPLPIVRNIDDYDEWVPDGHKVDAEVGDTIPHSLQVAVLSFLIGTTIRKLRGQHDKHNSMLVHVTRFTRIQATVANQVQDFLDDVRDRVTFGEGANPAIRELIRQTFETDHLPTSSAMATIPDVNDMVGEVPSFESVWAELPKVVTKTQVHIVNGTSSDALEYVDHPEGLTVIAIGGDKLSRGLTLEGLTVSYYLRASKMYDTLMQMGRWFGYRPGYLDLCRLYIPPLLERWYAFITAANEELQAEFEAMAAVGRTPELFGLRVRQHPSGLLVTSPTKQRHAISLQISYSGTIIETVTYAKRHAAKNWERLAELVTSLGSTDDTQSGLLVWRDRRSDLVLEFLAGYGADAAASKALPSILSQYVQSRVSDNELTSWTIALADVDQAGAVLRDVGPRKIHLTHRRELVSEPNRFTIRRLVSPRHELVDLDRNSAAWEEALEHSIEAWEASTRKKKRQEAPDVPSGVFARQARSPENGLLILYPLNPKPAITKAPGEILDGSIPLVGFAISFPGSDRAAPIEYKVNTVYWESEFASYFDDEDDE